MDIAEQASGDVVRLEHRKRSAALARPIIRIEGGELHEYAADAENLLVEDFYVRGGQLVRLARNTELATMTTPDLRRDDGQFVVMSVNVEYLQRELTRRADFRKLTSDGDWKSIDCPKGLATNIVKATEWPDFRPLTGIARAPFLRSDFTVCEEPGYDEQTGIFYQPSEPFPRLPADLSKSAADAALQRLLDPFSEFPFDNEISKAVFVAHLLTAAARTAMDTAPLFCYTAPVMGTGKTLLGGIAALLTSGTGGALHPYTDKEEEIRKVLFAALLAGDIHITLDNVVQGGRVRSSSLCAFLTAEIYSDRKLGFSENPTLPNQTILVLTGNNITPAGDLSRRSLVCRLDVNKESAIGRSFRIPDLRRHVLAHRADLLVSLLTIIRAFVVAKPPATVPPLASFERWSRLVREPLLWLGLEDPVASQAIEGDDDIAPLREAFEELSKFAIDDGKAGFKAQDVANFLSRLDGSLALRGKLEAAGCADPRKAKDVGYWLRRHRDRVAGSWKLVVASSGHGRTAVWRVKSV